MIAVHSGGSGRAYAPTWPPPTIVMKAPMRHRLGAATLRTTCLGYLLNRSCPAQRVALGGSDLAELNQRPGPMTFSYRSCSTYVNSPVGPYGVASSARSEALTCQAQPGNGRRPNGTRDMPLNGTGRDREP